jgi:hypothetical protein
VAKHQSHRAERPPPPPPCRAALATTALQRLRYVSEFQLRPAVAYGMSCAGCSVDEVAAAVTARGGRLPACVQVSVFHWGGLPLLQPGMCRGQGALAAAIANPPSHLHADAACRRHHRCGTGSRRCARS